MEARRRPRAGKTRIPGQRVESFSICGSRADVARCFHWKMHFHGAGEMKETARLFLCFEHSFSISLSLSLSLNSLLLRFKPRPFFFEHGFSSSTRGKNRSRERIFHGEIFVAPRSFPHDYATRQLFCSLQYNFESRAKLFPMIQREREREREQASAKVGQGSTYLFDSVPFFNGR